MPASPTIALWRAWPRKPLQDKNKRGVSVDESKGRGNEKGLTSMVYPC